MAGVAQRKPLTQGLGTSFPEEVISKPSLGRLLASLRCDDNTYVISVSSQQPRREAMTEAIFLASERGI